MVKCDNIQLSRNFGRLAFSNLLAQSAEQTALAAAPLVAVLALQATVAEIGWLQVALTLPFLLFAIPAGLLADRMSKQRLMAYAEGLRAASLVAIVILLFFEQLTLPLLAIVGLVGVCGTVVFTVAAPALVPSIVPSRLFGKANSRLELAATLAFMAGPAIGGALVGWTGAIAAFGMACALSIYATALLHRIEEPIRPSVVHRNPFTDIREGANFVFGHQHLAPIFATQFVFNAAFFVLMAVFVPYAVRNLNMSASETGLIMSMLGVGMFLGAFGAPRALNMLPFGTVIAVGPICGFVASLLMVATIWLPFPVLTALSFFLLGAGPTLWIVSTTTLRQAVTPPELLGRVSAINVLARGARPVGAGIAALVGGALGAEACLIVAAAGFGTQALIIILSPSVRLAQQPDQAVSDQHQIHPLKTESS